jgi:high-affinity iron transporter
MGSFVIVLREGFEAALMVGLILGVLNKTGEREHVRSVWLGAAAALVSSAIIGAILFAAVGELSGQAEKLYEGTAMLLAASVVTWMVFWMRKQARTLGGHLRSQVSTALIAGGGLALASVAFIGVAREGLESALFLFASVGDTGLAQTLVGGGLGALAAVTLGILFYKGSIRLDLRRFFMVTGVLVIGFAAYLIHGGLHEFGEAGGGSVFEIAAPVLAALYGIALGTFYLRSNPARPEPTPASAVAVSEQVATPEREPNAAPARA